MCRNYSQANTHSFDASGLTVQASTLQARPITVPVSTERPERPKVVIDTKDLSAQALKELKKCDPFLYYSIPFVRDAALNNGNHFQSSSLRDGSQSTTTKVERKSRISYECHPDLLLDGLLDDLDEPESSLEPEGSSIDVDLILQLLLKQKDEEKQRRTEQGQRKGRAFCKSEAILQSIRT